MRPSAVANTVRILAVGLLATSVARASGAGEDNRSAPGMAISCTTNSTARRKSG